MVDMDKFHMFQQLKTKYIRRKMTFYTDCKAKRQEKKGKFDSLKANCKDIHTGLVRHKKMNCQR